MASSSSARSVLSALRSTFVASHLTSAFAASGVAAAAQRTGAVASVHAARRNMSASAEQGRHQLITVELVGLDTTLHHVIIVRQNTVQSMTASMGSMLSIA